MDIQFQGFSPVAPPIFLALLALLVLFVSWWSYSYLQALPPSVRYLLSLLRAFSLILLLILLLNPLFTQRIESEREPVILLYLDDSESMSAEKPQYGGHATYTEVLDDLLEAKPDRWRLEIYGFGSEVRPLQTEEERPELTLGQGATDLDQVLNHLAQNSNRSEAAVLLSDGIVTRGRDPVHRAAELPVPVMTVPLGDTSEVRDLAIRDVFYQESNLLHTEQDVTVSFQQHGYRGEETTLRLFREGEQIESRRILLEEERRIRQENFRISFDEPGLTSFEVRIDSLRGEWNQENNRYGFTVDVRDDRLNIHHLAFQIHPDVRWLRMMLRSDPKIELTAYTWLGEEFMEGAWQRSQDDEVHLLILHGLPAFEPEELTEAFTANHVLQLLTGGNGEEKFHLPPLPDGFPDRGETGWVRPSEPMDSSHMILDTGVFPNERFPLLSANIIESPPPSSSVLLSGELERDLSVPLLLTEEAGSTRRAALLAGGWYRYQLAEDEVVRRYAERLLMNLVYWTASPAGRSPYEIAPARRVFQPGEPVQFRSRMTVTTPAGVTLPDRVPIYIENEEGERREYAMQEVNGQLELVIDNLPPGRYRYEAGLEEDLEEQAHSGEFVVESASVELLDTRRNDLLLRRIAEMSNGQLIGHDSISELWSHLEELPGFEPTVETTDELRLLVHSPVWFLLLVLLLVAEWLLRKRYSLP